MSLNHLTDAVLLARLQALVSQERGSVADVVQHLAEVDRREIVVDAGYTTLFDYCVKTLRYSEAAAFTRIRAARAVAEFPRVLVDLRSGALHLDAVARLSPHLSESNSDRILDQASGATKREVLALVASLDPSASAPERDVIRRLPPKQAEAPVVVPKLEPEPGIPNDKPGTPSAPAIIPPASRIRLGFTADDEFIVIYERLKSLCRHTFPAGGLEDLLKYAVTTTLDKIDPDRKPPCRERATKASASKRRRRVPESVKRKVWSRDEGRCAYVSPDGRRCESREFLEYDHIVPWALGGASDSVSNIRLLCRPHNQRLARRKFGPRRRDRALLCPDTPEAARDAVTK